MAQRLDSGGQPFPTVRRGFDPDQVRSKLAELEREIVALRLRAERAEGALAESTRTPIPIADLDEATIAARLGDEAARVLTTAHHAAAEMRARAEEHLQRTLREAQDDAGRIRADSEIEAARRRQDAVAAAENHIESVKQQGREMLSEAHAVRERVLADLARRRDAGRRQLEQLKAGRDRLLAAYDVTRVALVQVTDELTRSVPEAQALAEGALARPLADVRGDSDTWLADLDKRDTGELRVLGGPAPIVMPEPERWTEPAAVVSEPAADDATNEAVEIAADEVASDEPDAGGAASADAQSDAAQPDAAPSDEPQFNEDGSPVDDLFARLRASRQDAVASARTVLAEAEPETATAAEDTTVLDVTDAAVAPSVAAPDDVVSESPAAVELPAELIRRSGELAPLEHALGRHLKRAMADEQNEVLDRLRRASATPTADVVFGVELDYLERYRAASEADLRTAALAGARSLGTSPLEAGAAVDNSEVVDAALAEVALEIARPLRERLVDCLIDAGPDADAATAMLRAAYREWKTQRLDGLATHVITTAYERGQLAALPTGTCVRWMVDPSGPICPDAEDNALAGVVVAGQPFPTGHVVPPAHLGCRCHLVVS